MGRLLFYAPVGDSDCSGYQCSIPGFCEGNLVLALDSSGKDLCITACKENSQCNWWSYNGADNVCALLSTCAIIDEACTTCVSGQKDCQGGVTGRYGFLEHLGAHNPPCWPKCLKNPTMKITQISILGYVLPLQKGTESGFLNI